MTLLSSKQPAEAYFIAFDFDEYLGTATVVSATVTAVDQITGDNVVATVTNVAAQAIVSPIVYVWVRAGTSGINYVITCTAVDSDGQTHELEGILPVRELPTLSALEPVSLTEAKLHLRLATTEALAAAYTDEDELLSRIIKTAREQAEGATWRCLVLQTLIYYLQAWPTTNFIRLPSPPLQSITSIKYTDCDNVEHTFADYTADMVSEPGRAVLNYNETWPTDVLAPSNPIKITYVAGYSIPDDVPSVIKSGMLLIINDLYDQRGEVVVGAPVSKNQGAIDNLLSLYSCKRFI